ncbi:MAG: SusC/RagA family TonB-linked outer membrane protein [Deferribacteres bacterium]|nr:SusC/RagA family TonB-linked outer membrane protein [candidate division KSB1 bacterium]MCB9500934.1 SusC/RagA family TonB-linked outer membrane protein [Deferribacteres bacterium]
MTKKLSLILAFVVLLLPGFILGQQLTTINGRITDEVGNPLVGANVFITGTTFGAAADVDGFFNFTAPATGQEVTLTGRFIGYTSKSAKITLSGGKITQNFELQEDVLQLEEVIVTGIGGTQIKRKLGMSVSKVQPELITKSNESNVVQSLAGKAPSVEVMQTSGEAGTSSYIRIRGGASIDRDTQPLFVVDGVPIDNSVHTLGNAGVGGTTTSGGAETSNRASDLNVEDIESIEVLKGAAAAAIYGSRASNGVVLITTKSGKPGKTTISYKYQFGTTEMDNSYPLQNWYGHGDKGKFSATTAYTWGPQLNVPGAPWYDSSQPTTETWDHSTEYSDGGYINSHDLSISGGNNLTTFYLSLGHYFEKGHWIAGSDYERISARLKGTQVITDKLKLIGNVMYSNVNANYIQRGDNLGGLTIGALRTPPDFNNWPYISPETGYHRSYRYPSAAELRVTRGYDNPYWSMYEVSNPNEIDRVQGYVKAEYDMTKWANLSYHVGSDYYTDKKLEILPPSSSREATGRIIRGADYMHEIDANLVATIQGDRFLNKWKFIDGTLMLGHNMNMRRNLESILIGTDMGVASGFDQLDNTVSVTSSEYEWQRNIESYFSQLTFDLYDQVYLTAAVRNDGSSTFGNSQKRHWYPKASAAWEFTKFKPVPYMNFGKVRFAYGVAGVQPGVYTTISAYQAGAEGFGEFTSAALENTYGGKAGFRHSTNLGNDNIKPERTREFEYGLDMSFLNSRLGMELTYYDQRTTDVILDLNVAPSTGSFSQTANGAILTNKGLELSLNLTPVKKRNITWDMGIIYASNKNKVIDLAGADWEYFGGSSYAIPGYALGTYRAQSWVRFGHGLMLDLDGDGVAETNIDEEYKGQWNKNDVYVGADGKPILAPVDLITPWSPNPKWTGSIRNEFTLFGKFTISTLVDIVYKRYMENRGKGQNYQYGVHEDTEVRDTEGPINHWFIHGEKAVGPGATNGVGNDFVYDQTWFRGLGGLSGGDGFQFIEDAGFVKLREVSVSYPLRFNFIKQYGLQDVSLRLSGRNLITKTDYTGWAPDSNRSQASNIRGVDYYNAPQTRVYTFTLRVNY